MGFFAVVGNRGQSTVFALGGRWRFVGSARPPALPRLPRPQTSQKVRLDPILKPVCTPIPRETGLKRD